MKILLLGGAGYIGSVLIPKLLRGNHRVIVVDNLSRGHYGLVSHISNPDFDFVYGDIRECALTKPLFADYKPDICINLAAIVGVPECDAAPDDAISINRDAAIEISELCDIYNTNLIIPSTLSIFSNEGEVDDNTFPTPISLYAQTKWAAEECCLKYDRVCVPRFTTVMGVSPNMRWGIMPNRLVRDATLRHINLYQPNILRSFIDVDDLATILLYIAEHFDKFEGVAFNVGAPLHLTKEEFAVRIGEHIPYVLDIVEGSDQDKRDFVCRFESMFRLIPGMSFWSLDHSIASLIKLAKMENLSNV